MNQEKDHINHYSANDILRYVAGKMSPGEMHAMEKAALDDPFLADAIEGMSQAMQEGNEDVMHNLQELRNEFTARTSPGPTPATMRYTRWWKVAAAVIVLIGSSVWTYEVFVRSGQPSYARKETPAVPAPAPLPARENTTAPSLPAPVDSGGIPEVARATVHKHHEQPKSAPPSATEKADALARSTTSEPASPGRQNDAVMPKALPHANDIAVQNDDQQKKKSAEAGLDSETARRAPAAPVAGKSAGNETILHDSANLAYRQPAPLGNEVVVSGYGKAKRRRGDFTKVMVQSAQPVIGWISYQQYIDSSKRVPEANPDLKGEVVLSFIVDPSGIPQNIRIEQSLNGVYDEEAIRLVREGPRWKLLGRRKARTTMIIRF